MQCSAVYSRCIVPFIKDGGNAPTALQQTRVDSTAEFSTALHWMMKYYDFQYQMPSGWKVAKQKLDGVGPFVADLSSCKLVHHYTKSTHMIFTTSYRHNCWMNHHWDFKILHKGDIESLKVTEIKTKIIHGPIFFNN